MGGKSLLDRSRVCYYSLPRGNNDKGYDDLVFKEILSKEKKKKTHCYAAENLCGVVICQSGAASKYFNSGALFVVKGILYSLFTPGPNVIS